MKNKKALIMSSILFTGVLSLYINTFNRVPSFQELASIVRLNTASVVSPFSDSFSGTQTINEAGSMSESSSPYWWLNSGGYFYYENGIGRTIQGDLPATDKWAKDYAISNPIDTDGGIHPQNVFRLVTKSKWENFTQEAYFKINKQNMSASPERNAWSGILFFNRYADGDNLYYTGIRVDGSAIIKSKKNGVYTTLNQPKILQGTYDRVNNPNLLPKNTWIGLKSEILKNKDGSVSIKLYIDNGKTGVWSLIASAIDSSNPILGTQYAGIRTDFMDVDFSNYKIEEITPPDTEAPTAPTNLTILSKNNSSVRFGWNASTDNVGVVGYNVYRNGIFYDSTRTSTTITVSGLTKGKTYDFSVKSKDKAGNLSLTSNVVTFDFK